MRHDLIPEKKAGPSFVRGNRLQEKRIRGLRKVAVQAASVDHDYPSYQLRAIRSYPGI